MENLANICSVYLSDNDDDNDSDFNLEDTEMEEASSPSSSSSDGSNMDTEPSVDEEEGSIGEGQDDIFNLDDADADAEDDFLMDIGPDPTAGDVELFEESDFNSDDEDDISISIIDCFNIFHYHMEDVSMKHIRAAFIMLLSTGLFHQVDFALQQLERFHRLDEFMLAPVDHFGHSLFLHACIVLNIPVIRLLMEYGFDMNLTCEEVVFILYPASITLDDSTPWNKVSREDLRVLLQDMGSIVRPDGESYKLSFLNRIYFKSLIRGMITDQFQVTELL